MSEPTGRELISLLQRRQAFCTRMLERHKAGWVKGGTVRYWEGIDAELHHLLGRCTAHNEGVRSIGPEGD